MGLCRVRHPVSMNPNAKPYVPKAARLGRRQVPRNLSIGQTKAFRISVDPNSENVHGAAAAFVLYGLIRGYPAQEAARTYLALVVLLKAAMESRIDLLKTAPRLWWQVTNALTPKSVHVRGQEIRYDWNMGNFSVNNVPSLGGVIFGVPLNSDTNGLYNLNVAAVTVPTENEAADLAANLWATYDEAHKVTEHVNDYIYDVGAFAYKIKIQDPSSVDVFSTQYGINASEAPHRSWFAYCGFGLSTASALPFRIPKYFSSTQGSSLQYIGARLHYPMLMQRSHNMTRINFRMFDLENVILKCTRALNDTRDKLEGAGRPQTTNNFIPDAYWGTIGGTSGLAVIDINLYALHNLLNVIGALASLSATWAGVVANGTASIATGTNLILPEMNETFAAPAWIAEVMGQMHPVYARRNDMLQVPVPVISDDFIPFFRTGFGAYFNTTTTMPTYGGNNLDLLNSQIGGQVVQIMNGPTIFTNRSSVMEADQIYNNQLDMKSVVPVIAPLRSRNVFRTRLLNGSFVKNTEKIVQLFDYIGTDRAAVKKFLAYLEAKKEVKAPFRTSPITSILPTVGMACAEPVPTDYPDDQLCVPVALFESPTVALNNQRLIAEDIETMITPLNAVIGYGITQFGICSSYTSDPNNDTKTDVMKAVTCDVDPVEIIDKFDPLVDLLPPAMRGAAKIAQKVAKAVAPAVKKAVQKGRERRQRKREAKKAN